MGQNFILFKKRLFAIFQPHTYSRTRLLLEEFANSFSECDYIIISDIYASREHDTGLIHSKDLVEKIKMHRDNVYYIGNFDDISKFLLENLICDDIVITMGAGNINNLADKLISSL